MMLKEYFSDKEMACHCGCGVLPDPVAVERLYALRILYGKPIPVRSAARCPSYNREVGGKETSLHITWSDHIDAVCWGEAFDCAILPEDEVHFLGLAVMVGFTGIGIKNNDFIHIDLGRETAALWTY